jgi:hypothetical protein
VKQFQLDANGERVELEPELFLFSRESSRLKKELLPAEAH